MGTCNHLRIRYIQRRISTSSTNLNRLTQIPTLSPSDKTNYIFSYTCLVQGVQPGLCKKIIFHLILPNFSNHLELRIIFYTESFNKNNYVEPFRFDAQSLKSCTQISTYKLVCILRGELKKTKSLQSMLVSCLQ